jgi:hypothetical protein
LNLSSYIPIIDENLSNVDKPKHPKTKVERKTTDGKTRVHAKRRNNQLWWGSQGEYEQVKHSKPPIAKNRSDNEREKNT